MAACVFGNLCYNLNGELCIQETQNEVKRGFGIPYILQSASTLA